MNGLLKAIRLAAPALAAAGLAACITLFPKDQPVQLYRFGQTAGAAAAPAAASTPRFDVALANVEFYRPAAGERILTSNGDQTAYIKGARWVGSAFTLFDDAVYRAFQRDGGPAQLLERGEPAHADATLKLDVRTFEARYGGDPSAPPTVRVEVYAALGFLRQPMDREKLFSAEAQASDNRIGAIAQAFDQAVGKVLADVAAWVDAKGQA